MASISLPLRHFFSLLHLTDVVYTILYLLDTMKNELLGRDVAEVSCELRKIDSGAYIVG